MNQIDFKIGGDTRRFNFGLKFLGDILSHFNTDIVGLGELLDSNPFATRPVILYYGHVASLKRNNKPVDFTLDDVIDWVDEMEGGISNEYVIQSVMLVLESVKTHIPKSDSPIDEDEAKKK